MSTHSHTTRADWITAATRYIVDHSDAGELDAAAYAREIADEQEGTEGPNPEDWIDPGTAAHSFMEDWDDNAGGGPEDDEP